MQSDYATSPKEDSTAMKVLHGRAADLPTEDLLASLGGPLRAGLDEEVEALQRRAQIALGVGRGRLVGSCGSVLDAFAPIKHAKLENGDVLLLQIQRTQVQTSGHTFAAVLGDGSVVTWGRASVGGDSSAVQDQLKNVQQIQASYSAFAAILGDGSVVTWGNAAAGGDSSAVQDQLKNVQQIQAILLDLQRRLGPVK
ncbi:hypothetical protein AK812_SmicGene46075, partial [Symbiodinium microadriaticum]